MKKAGKSTAREKPVPLGDRLSATIRVRAADAHKVRLFGLGREVSQTKGDDDATA